MSNGVWWSMPGSPARAARWDKILLGQLDSAPGGNRPNSPQAAPALEPCEARS